MNLNERMQQNPKTSFSIENLKRNVYYGFEFRNGTNLFGYFDTVVRSGGAMHVIASKQPNGQGGVVFAEPPARIVRAVVWPNNMPDPA